MNKVTWANAEHYEKAFEYLEEKEMDTENTYFYIELLGSKGLTVFVSDLKDWIKSRKTVLNTGEFEL